MLWDWIKSTVPSEGLKRGHDVSESSLTPFFGLLTMFSLVYHYLLITVDNAEFYETQYPFTLAQVDMHRKSSGC